MTSDTLSYLPYRFSFDDPVRLLSSFGPGLAVREHGSTCLYPCAGMQPDQEQPSEPSHPDLARTTVVGTQSDNESRYSVANVTILGGIPIDRPSNVVDPGQIVESSTTAEGFQQHSVQVHQTQRYDTQAIRTTPMYTPTSKSTVPPSDPASHPQRSPGEQAASSLRGRRYYSPSEIPIEEAASPPGSGLRAAAGTHAASSRGGSTTVPGHTQRPDQAQNPGRAHRFCHACHHINHVRRKKCTNCNAPKTVVKGATWRPSVQRTRRDTGVPAIRPVLPGVAQRRDVAGGSSSSTSHTYFAASKEARSGSAARVGPPPAAMQVEDPVQTQEWEAAIDDALDLESKGHDEEFEGF